MSIQHPLQLGVGGPVGSGKTALIEALCKKMRHRYSCAVVTNDIYTQEDAQFLTRNQALPADRIMGVETGGCPHTAIREDASMNLNAVAEMQARFSDLDLVIIESGGDNLSATFSPELADLAIYVIDVSAGDKIPRKGGPGIARSDLLVINKIDLAPHVGADLEVMRRDAGTMRGTRPFVFTNLKTGQGLDRVIEFIERDGLLLEKKNDSDYQSRMKKKIPVGILHSLSGTMSFSEAPLVDAALMAFDEINQDGGVLGYSINPLVEDCGSDAETYAIKTQRLNQKQDVTHFFGCWTSASRKAAKPVLETVDGLLWYPVQYEGLEESANIVYTGNCLNQQIEPAFHWAAENLGKSCYLVGSDYIFPRTANRFIRTLCNRHGVRVLGENYLPLGAENFERIVGAIKKLKPAVVFNTINGDSNLAFYYYLNRTGIRPEQIPVMAFSIGEVELRDIGPSAIGHYACSGYFQCLDTLENIAFIGRYRKRYGNAKAVSDAVVSAYIQPYLWKNLVERSRSFEVAVLKKNISGTTHTGPCGNITIHANHHAFKPALIGRVNGDLQFDLIWQSPEWIPPLPWLGLEQVDITAKEMIKDALAAFPEMLDAIRMSKPEMARRKKN